MVVADADNSSLAAASSMVTARVEGTLPAEFFQVHFLLCPVSLT